jgi:hypothetical protein
MFLANFVEFLEEGFSGGAGVRVGFVGFEESGFFFEVFFFCEAFVEDVVRCVL